MLQLPWLVCFGTGRIFQQRKTGLLKRQQTEWNNDNFMQMRLQDQVQFGRIARDQREGGRRGPIKIDGSRHVLQPSVWVLPQK